jgi:O-glycosyl hydrolase
MRTGIHDATAIALTASLTLFAACTASEFSVRAPQAVFAFDPAARHQTIEGWGGLLANWHWADGASGPGTPIRDDVEQHLLRELVFDLGLNRFGINLPAGRIEPVNDNDDAFTVNRAGFDFSNIDPYVRDQLLPLRALLRERGEPFVFYASVVLFSPTPGGTPNFIVENPDEYVEFALVAMDYFRGYGLEPDYWIVVNEPDFVRVWTPADYARLTAQLGERLRAAGYRTRISAPDAVHPSGASAWLATLVNTPGAREHLGMISYHSYDYDPTIGEAPPSAPRAVLANWSRELALPVAQTEQGQAGKKNAATRWGGLQHDQALDIAQNIFADLLYADASAWQLHAIIGWGTLPDARIGGTFIAARHDGSGYDKPAHYWAVRHFSRFLHPGAARVGLRPVSPRSLVLAAAFLSPAGQPVLVAMNSSQAAHDIRFTNLPPGAYRLSLTTREQKGAEQSLGVLSTGQSLDFALPPESIATIWQE